MKASQSKKDATYRRPTGQVCSNCIFSLFDEEGETRDCRRNPPATINANATRGVFPTVLDSDWCGEYAAPGGAVPAGKAPPPPPGGTPKA